MGKKMSKICMRCALAAVWAVLPLAACTPAQEYEEGTKVVFDYNDGVSRPYTVEIMGEEQVSMPATPVRAGYVFDDWYTAAEGGERISFPYTASSDVRLYAHWNAQACTVTFDYNYDGSAAEEKEIFYGAAVSAPQEIPQREGYYFYYWQTKEEGGAEVTFPYTVKRDVTFYARWVAENVHIYTVSFELGYGDAEQTDSLTLLEGEQVTAVQAGSPKRTGYSFLGWSLAENGATVAFPYTPHGDVTLYAVWQQAEYTVRFANNFVDAPETYYERQTVLGGEDILAPAAAPVRAGYAFAGWYTTAKGGAPVSFPVAATGHATYYAHWTSNPVQTNIFDAEFTEFDPNEEFPGYSGEVKGAGCVLSDTSSGAHSEEYPLNSKVTAHNSYYVSYLYKQGATLTFVIRSSAAVDNVTLKASLATEINNNLTIGPSGENAFRFVVNGTDLAYAPIVFTGSMPSTGQYKGTFAEYTIATNVSLKEGENVIQLITANSNGGAMGGTMKAVAPMVDYIKLENYGSAVLTWSPVYDNIY